MTIHQSFEDAKAAFAEAMFKRLRAREFNAQARETARLSADALKAADWEVEDCERRLLNVMKADVCLLHKIEYIVETDETGCRTCGYRVWPDTIRDDAFEKAKA